MTLIIILVVSIALNILLLWYLKNILEKLMFVSDNIGGLVDSVNIFGEHAKSIYELDRYYGDETLESLIAHLKDLHEDVKEFEQIYSLTDQEGAEEEEIYDDDEAEEVEKT